MTSTRLLNLHTYELEPYEIGDMPSYVAISHVWSERFFPISAKGDPQTAEGIPMIRQIFKDSRYPITSYCWIDTWCIDQGDDLTDKFEQIYRMADIYKQAQLVIIIVRHTFTFSQDQWDAATAGCRDLLDSAFFEGEGWATRVAMVTPASVSAFSDLLLMIEELAQLKWPTRIWTAQEYILAKSDAWIGLDLQPLTLPAQDIWSVCEAVLWRDRQDSLLHPELHASYRFPPIVGVVNWNLYLMNMVKTRSSGICLQAMLLAGTRQCAEPVDEIYGLMAASGVVIAPIRGESAAAAWKRWWEHSIVSGDFGFLLTYSTLFRPVRDWNCAMPPFDVRCQLGNLTRSSRIPWGPVTVNPSDGTITLIGRIAGHLTIDKKLSSAGGAGGPAKPPVTPPSSPRKQPTKLINSVISPFPGPSVAPKPRASRN
ncbi:hypothetical protein K490DRAFT_59290 [Saccharata proteae CBS 121410]|uniref:Heterokaryon incompatibility domain-containing protein n=1 Tax=Saccharata proteae CBS 121410 TaxID=1314787 RepID=A0A9P4HSG0_9PEZI|nr:hypothetical protein K490DRAFT_59290 [Saccharata proteae CBS 121410]